VKKTEKRPLEKSRRGQARSGSQVIPRIFGLFTRRVVDKGAKGKKKGIFGLRSRSRIPLILNAKVPTGRDGVRGRSTADQPCGSRREESEEGVAEDKKSEDGSRLSYDYESSK